MKTLFTLVAAASILTSGCATRDYVDQSVAALGQSTDQRLAALSTSTDQRIGATDALARQALERANAANRLAEGKFVYSATFTDDTAKFERGQADLSAEAEARLTQIAEQLIAANRNAYIEIQGHTDSTGTPRVNHQVGQLRADAVRLFLNQRGVPLNRMAAISYRDIAPVAPNDTPEGRAANRRVVLIVMQ